MLITRLTIVDTIIKFFPYIWALIDVVSATLEIHHFE